MKILGTMIFMLVGLFLVSLAFEPDIAKDFAKAIIRLFLELFKWITTQVWSAIEKYQRNRKMKKEEEN